MIVDIIVSVILVGSAIISFLRGFIREILTIFGIIGGMIAAYIGGPLLVPHMSAWLGIKEGEEIPKLFDVIPYDMVANALSYGSIFLGFAIILSIISHIISEGASKIGLGALDRTLGVAFGLARGVLVLGLVYLPFLYMTTEETRDTWFQDSKTHVYVEATSLWLSNFIPKETTDKLKESAQKLEETNEARKKLQELEMLPGGEKKDESQDPAAEQKQLNSNEQPPINQSGTDGYAPEFRNQMQDLIEQNTGGEKPQPLQQQEPEE
jgi:membrane protein required for colicin V production